MNAMAPLSFVMLVGYGSLLIWVIMLQPYFLFSDGCLQDERSYLLDFKAGLNLSTGRLSSWRGMNCCEWEGVGCDYHTSHVITLDLSIEPYESNGNWYNEYLHGELRPSLFNLQHLQHLDLSGNDFNDICIPSQLSKLHRLTFLSLAEAGFSCEVPLWLGNMSSLRHLDLSPASSSPNLIYYNTLSSNNFDVWVRHLRSLEFIRMESANMTMASDRWNEALGGLPNLTQIHLAGCGLSGNIPNFSNLTRLSHLHIGCNSFQFELPSWFENVSSLVSLDLTFCGLNGSIPSNFMPRSKLNNLVLTDNPNLKGNLSFTLQHSSSLVLLSLGGCNLRGALPPSITNLSKLQLLDVSDTMLEGSIPSSFGNFLCLKFMVMSYNNLEGTIPFSFANISSLRYLDLRRNKLSGHISPSLCQLPALRSLILGRNQLSGTIPVSISKMVSLEELSLHSNSLRGGISLQLFENLTQLKALDLSANQLQFNISTRWVPQFDYLEMLGLRSCNLKGEIPTFLSQQYQLGWLDLSDNNIEGNIPRWLWDLPNLQYLNLSNNQLEGSLPRKISHIFRCIGLHGNRLHGPLPALDFVSYLLDLSNNGFNGSIPERIGRIYSLRLSGNNLTGQIPRSVCNNSGIYYALDLSNNKLTGEVPPTIGQCSELEILKLAHNDLHGEIPQNLGNLQNLYTLNLNGNNLKGIIPPSLANCTSLEVLDLGSNKIEGTIPIWVEKLTDLRVLCLASNELNYMIPSELFKLQNLQILDLSGNQLSGSILPDVRNLHALVNDSQSSHVQYYRYRFIGFYLESSYGFNFADEVTVWIKGRETSYFKIIGEDKFIDLSHNNLSGDIPSELGLLKGLISLNLSKNNLSGSIPESLGAMIQLESLDLSENKLSGKIPYQLLNLTFLAVLNLSRNMLCGLIPQGKQFSTFEASSFLGNPSLHGVPLENRTINSSLGTIEKLNNTVGKDAAGDVMDRWWAIGVGLSYGMGFAIVIAVLCFHVKWRYMCFARMDYLINYLFEP